MLTNPDKLDRLATIFVLAPLTVMSARGIRAPKWLVGVMVGVTVWQAYRAVQELSQ